MFSSFISSVSQLNTLLYFGIPLKLNAHMSLKDKEKHYISLITWHVILQNSERRSLEVRASLQLKRVKELWN